MYIVESRGDVLRHFIRRMADPDLHFHLSDLVRMECLVLPLKNQDVLLLDDYRRFFDLVQAAWIPMGRSVFTRAAQLRAEYRIKTPDALHVAAALEAGCVEFWTNDRQLGVLTSLIHMEFVH